MEVSCVIALFFVIFSEILSFIESSNWYRIRAYDTGEADNWLSFLSLDPEYIEKRFTSDAQSSFSLLGFSSVVKAIATFAFFVPMLQVSWILSDGGKRHISALVIICSLVVAGGLSQLLVNLMIIGAHNATFWIVKSFNLSNWNSDGDGTGWRVVEIVHIMLQGLTTWMDALEWICIFIIMTIIFFIVRHESKNNNNNEAFGKKWSILGLVIGTLGLFEFSAELMRFKSWRKASEVSFLLDIINMWILVPIWLYVLGNQLKAVKENFENWRLPEEEDHATHQLNLEVASVS